MTEDQSNSNRDVNIYYTHITQMEHIPLTESVSAVSQKMGIYWNIPKTDL
jgi:hypothetical protein